MNRRIFLGGLAGLPFMSARGARARTGPPTVGYLSGGDKGSKLDLQYREPIAKGLAEQGFVEPDRVRWLERYAGVIPERPKMIVALEALARELVAEGAEVIVANGASTVPAMTVAGAVPVVYGFSGDPVAGGIADSLSRPRGNATGVTLMWPEANAKRIEILKEMAPGIRRIALISSPTHPGEPAEIEVCRRSVASLGIDMTYMPVFNAADLEKALVQAAAEGADAVVSPPDPITVPNSARLADWARQRRVPFVSGWSLQADSGALMTYGPNVSWGFQRVGYYAARILRGAKPADLPIEQPSRFELVLNLQTARAIGLTISDFMLGRADRVIE